MRCISSGSYSFLINGEVNGFLQPSRGLRQGDPLSPYLFVICAHGLSKLLLSSEKRKLFKGVKIAASCPPISHLFFADDSLIFCRARSMDCANLRHCLDCYSKASGQLVNFEKSALSFSPNTSAYVREEICSLFGISQVAGHDMYLGLPTFSMRNKRIQFGYIRDMMVKKLQDWKENFFSQGGKEVLLKAVVQAIPTYAMTCFMIPDNILKEIEAACACFWWGSTPDHKRVHWKKWSDLCQPKAAGGMGFKDLSLFNQALLGKQVWRITQNPQSLVVQVLKARYFPYSSIWEAEALSNASYVWKSILWGRNLVAHGMRWRVGNGSKISVYNSRWIPKPWNFKVCSPRTLPNNSLVADLLDENGRWNVPLISQMFLNFEAKIILALPRPAVGCFSADKQDSYCWHYDAKCLYSVKSAYHLGMELACSLNPSSTNPATGSWWNALWNASIPPKVKVFWWRAIHDILPTTWNLRRHHIPAVASCALCGYGLETTSHSLFLCSLMKPFWKSTQWASCLEVVQSRGIWDVATWVKEIWDERYFEIFLLFVWESWNLRNLLVHGSSKKVSGMELCNMDVLLDEFQVACRSASPSIPVTCLRPDRWTAPLDTILRLDVDASYCQASGLFSAGAVIRDSLGAIVHAGAWPNLQVSHVGQAELQAVFMGLGLASVHGLSKLMVFSDASCEVAKINSSVFPVNEDGFLLEGIRHLCSLLNVISVDYVSRHCNTIAHDLARHALSLSSPMTWNVLNSLSWLIQSVLDDVSSL
ncbi:hypothetical protein UlMin_040768 [Ulmus minor]